MPYSPDKTLQFFFVLKLILCLQSFILIFDETPVLPNHIF